MTFVSTALAMVAVLFGLGAPVALVALPRAWRMHWPVLAPLGGAALASLVAWLAAISGHRLSLSWTWAAVIAAGVLAAGVVLRERRRLPRLVFRGLRRHGAVLVLTCGVLLVTARPFAQARLGLTTISLGSCDAADYAAGANLLRDVDPDDRSGFNGHTETVALRSVDTFYGHWLRLNHFAPAALLAWFSQLFGLPVFKLVTALAIALHAAAVPAVFWLARAGLRLGAFAALAVAASWSISAPALYGVGHTALGQIMVVPAVALLTWAGLRAFVEGGTVRGVVRWAPCAACGFVVLVAGYTFALVFVLAPLAAALVWMAWQRAGGALRLLRVTAMGAGVLTLTGLVFSERMAGLADRFGLFEAIDFGWHIPVLTPERWMGWFGDERLGAGDPLVAWIVGGLTLAALVFYACRAWRRDRLVLGIALGWLMTVAGGYGLLAAKGVREGSNELYNAYKVFALLQPLSLAALMVPLRSVRLGGHALRFAAALAAGAVVAIHAAGSAPLRVAITQPHLWVNKAMRSIAAVADRQDVTSVNMLLGPMWARLWANAMLLNKPQFFRTDTYEGRHAGPLAGEWDLRDALLTVDAGPGATIELEGGFHLVRSAGPFALRVDLGAGWHDVESSGAARWVWSSREESTIRLSRPGAAGATARLVMALQGNGPRTVEVTLDGVREPLWCGLVDGRTIGIDLGTVELPAGDTLLRIRSLDPMSAAAGDGRLLGVALHNLKVTMENQQP